MSFVVIDNFGIDIEAKNYFGRLTSPSISLRKAVNKFIKGVKSDNGLGMLSNGFEYIHISGGVGFEANAKINLVNTSFYHIAVNSPTWSSQGYTGNGTTSYLNSQFTPSTSATVLSQNDAFLGTYVRTNSQTGFSAGSLNAAATIGLQVLPRFTDDTFRIRNNAGTFGSLANTDSRGFFVSERTDSTNIKNWKNGSMVLSSAVNSVGLPDVPIWHLANNFNNTFQLGSTGQQAFDCCGKASRVNQTLLYIRVQQLAIDLGFNV